MPEFPHKMHITVLLSDIQVLGLDEGQRVTHAWYDPQYQLLNIEIEGEGLGSKQTAPGAASVGAQIRKDFSTIKVVIDREELLTREQERLAHAEKILGTVQYATDRMKYGSPREG